VVSGCLVDDLCHYVDRRQYNADCSIDGCSLSVIAVPTAGVHRRDSVSDHWDVFQTPHHDIVSTTLSWRLHPTTNDDNFTVFQLSTLSKLN